MVTYRDVESAMDLVNSTMRDLHEKIYKVSSSQDEIDYCLEMHFSAWRSYYYARHEYFLARPPQYDSEEY